MNDERRGSAWFGLPAMIGLLAIVAFKGTSVGIVGGAVAVLIVFLAIGAVVSVGRRRPGPKDSPPDQ
jgi:hypothetical protein